MYVSLDIGTNTVRMLLGEVSDGSVSPEKYLRRITRLGGGFDPAVGLADLSMSRTLGALTDFSKELQDCSISGISAIATEALRRAKNSADFIEQARIQSGFDIQVIPGEREAELSCAGVLTALDSIPEHLLIFDIGGGSTEFVYAVQGKPVFYRSYPLGTVMLCEHHPGDVAQQAHIDRTLRYLHDDLTQEGFEFPLPAGLVPVGTAGTVTTLAALDLEMAKYDWRRVNNHVLSYARLKDIEGRLLPLSVSERENLAGMEKGRGDLILPGVRIVESILDFCGSPELIVSDFGLLEGGLLSAANAL